MKAKFRFLSVLLVVAMCFSLMAASASAGAAVIIVEGSNDSSNQSNIIVGNTEGALTPAASPSPSVQPQGGSNGIIVAGLMSGNGGAEPASDNLKEDTVAVIGQVEYSTIKAAVDAAAANNSTVKLVKDISAKKSTLSISDSMTLDLNGNTLSFVPEKNEAAAIDVEKGTVVIKNGTITVSTAQVGQNTVGFATGISSAGALSLRNVELVYTAPSGGNMLAKSGSGSISIEDGSYSADPSVFLASGYTASLGSDNMYQVTKSSGSDEPVVVPTTVAKIGDTEYETLAAAITAAKDGDTVILQAAATEDVSVDKNITIDFNTFTLTGTVDSSGTVTLTNGTVTGTVTSSGALTLSKITVADISLTGGSINVATADVKTGNISTTGTVTVNISAGQFGALSAGTGSTVTGNVTGGTFTAQVPAAFVATGYRATTASPFTVETIPAEGTITDGSGAAISNFHYYKGAGESGNNAERVFKVSPGLSTLSVNSTTLTAGTDYTLSADGLTVTIAKEAAFLKNLPAGSNTLTFTLDNGAVKEISVYVWPSVSFNKEYYVKGSGSGVIVTISDRPEYIAVAGSNSGTAEASARLTSNDYTANSDGTYTIKSEYLDKLTTGTQYIGFGTNVGVLAFPYRIAAAPSITAVDTNKDAKWLNVSSNTLGFNVSPDVKGVSVDGASVDSRNYSVNSSNVLTLSSAYLATLAYGEHTLSVSTTDGPVSIKFTTAPSVVAKNGSNHTKGGSNDLAFVASDAMNAVYVGQTALTSSQYTLSSDGKTITLKAAFLNTLKQDTTYTLTVNGTSGSAATTFRILSASSAAANPKTGDDSNLLAWAAVLLLSGGAVVALLPKLKKQ